MQIFFKSLFVVSFLVIIFAFIACNGNGTNDEGDADIDADTDSDVDVARDGDYDEDSGGEADGDSESDSDIGGLSIATLGASTSSITEGETVTFTATVTHPDGTDAIAGGSLTTPDGGTVYGPFVLAAGSTYSIDMSWVQIHEIEAIEFGSEVSRTFQAEFFDIFKNRATRTTELGLNCDGIAACDGVCTDLSNNANNCGACGRECTRRGIGSGIGGCEDSDCLPTVSECIVTSKYSNCSEYCTSIGEECAVAACAGNTGVFYFSSSECESYRSLYSEEGPCIEAFDTDAAYAARCCCTVTL